jgi:hypothetical protein
MEYRDSWLSSMQGSLCRAKATIFLPVRLMLCFCSGIVGSRHGSVAPLKTGVYQVYRRDMLPFDLTGPRRDSYFFSVKEKVLASGI